MMDIIKTLKDLKKYHERLIKINIKQDGLKIKIGEKKVFLEPPLKTMSDTFYKKLSNLINSEICITKEVIGKIEAKISELQTDLFDEEDK